MDKNKCSSCGEAPHKCSCKNKEFTKAVVEINNPEQITLMRKVTIPASMGDDTTVPPVVGKYHNVLLYYEANSKSYLYSSDGIPTQLVNGLTDYEAAVNLPQINGVTLLGDKSSADLKLADAPMVITVANGNTSWSGADTAEDVYDFFLNKGKVNIIFNGDENYSYEIASAAYIPGEEKMMCTLAVATIAAGETSEFEGNALFGTMTLYTAGKTIDVSQIELQPKLFITDFTGLDLNYNELSGVPATNASIGMVKSGNGLEVASDGTMSAKAGTNITVDSNGINEAPYEDYLPIEMKEVRYVDSDNNTNTYVHYSIIDKAYKPIMVMSDPDDPNVGKTASEFDFEYTPTLMTNMSPWDTALPHVTYGPLIIDHEIKVQNNLGSGTVWNRPIVGIDDDGVLHNIDGSTAAADVNMKYASRAWTTLYNDGVVNPDISSLTNHNPRTWLAQDYDGNYFIGVCGGRQAEDTGMLAVDEMNFVLDFLNFNARVIWNYDGGGSSNFLYHGIRQNRLVEREDRACPTWLVWRSDTAKHEGLFKNQSLNSQANVIGEINEDGHIITNDSIVANGMVGSEYITSNAGSRIMKATPRVVVYNLNFQVTGENNLPSYSDLYINLPRTDSNYYFLALKHADYSTVPMYITSMDDTSYSRIRNIQALEPGTYSIHFTVQCNTQY